METVFLCPDVNCKLKLPSQATLLTHMKMCHSAEDVKIAARVEPEYTCPVCLDELQPYVMPLLDPGAAVTKLVLQHARSVVANDGSVSYVAR